MNSARLHYLGMLLITLGAGACSSDEDDDDATRPAIFEQDVNDDGFITKDEWTGSDALFNAYDQNGDGYISLVEARMEPADAGPADSGTPDAGEMDAGTVMSKCEPPGPEMQPGSAPIRRGDMAFAYDTSCDRVIMFFGDKAEPQMCGPAASDFLTDGWVFDPARGTWAQIPDPSGPAPQHRARSSGVWDPNSNRMILFGGRYRAGTSGAYQFFNDIWAYDPSTNTWEELAGMNAPNAPNGRMNTLMVADPDNNRILIHDGGTTDFTSFPIDEGVWAFDLNAKTWEKLAVGGTLPTARLFHTGALDRQRNRLYIFGGGGEDAFTSVTFFKDLWYLDLNTLTWTQIPESGEWPRGRIKGVMDYDEARDQIILFAGHDDGNLGNDNDVWAFHLETEQWELKSLGDTFNRGQFGFCDFPADFANVDLSTPERRESHLFVINGDQAFMYGGRTDCGLSNDTWILNLEDTTWEQINESFNGMTCYRSGRTDCDDPEARKCG